MSLVIAENITQAFGTHEVLRRVTFRLGESDRIGLVGPNGEGKTTLLRVIAGQLEPTIGSVHRSRGLRIGYLPQDTPVLEDATIHEVMLEVFADVRRLRRQLDQLAGQMDGGADDDRNLHKKYDRMQTELETLGGYDYQTRIEQVLTGLGFERQIWDRPVSQLSGGQRTRVYLATLLLQNPHVLMLDEPTNHLDLDSVEWLESWLQSFRGALIVVSHDRYFLDRVTGSTWEIAFGNLETYRGQYSKYLPQRDERYKQRMRLWQSQQEYIAKTEEYIARNISGQRGREARGRRTRLERFLRDEAIARPREHRTINISLPAGRRTGDMVFQARDLEVGYEPGKPLLKCEALEVRRSERVAILGANGAGKTTLMRTLLGDLEPPAGSVRHGAGVRIGYVPQTHEMLDPDSTALEAVMAAESDCKRQRAMSVLGSLLLGQDDALKRICELSGGQRSRVVLARLMVQNANVLLLDEPTNHLDIPSTEIMQDVLQRFDGTVLFVSHDRYLIRAVATHVWVIDGEQVRCIGGGWEAFLAWRDGHPGRDDRAGTDRAAAGGKPKQQRKDEYRQARRQANLMQRLKRRHEQIEAEIETIEAELAKLNDEISVAGDAGEADRVQQLCKEYPQREARLEALWKEWEQVGQEME